jgi:hypothetical protein
MILTQNPKPLGSKTSMLLIHVVCFQLEALGQFTLCFDNTENNWNSEENP